MIDCSVRHARNLTVVLLLMFGLTSLAIAEPQELYNKTIYITYTVSVPIARPSGGTFIGTRHVKRWFYVSSLGRIFLRDLRTTANAAETKNMAPDQTTFKFEGDTMVGVMQHVSGASQMIVSFGDRFQNCTFDVVTGKESGQPVKFRGLDGVLREAVGPMTISHKTCEIKDGNIFVGEDATDSAAAVNNTATDKTVTAHAQGAPADLRGKSITVAWTEDRVFRFVGEENFTTRAFAKSMSVYVSSQGRAFARLTSFGRRGRASSHESIGDGGDWQASQINGHTLTVTNKFKGGARLVRVDFNQDFSGCTADVIAGRESANTVARMHSMISGRMMEIKSAKVSGASCSLRSGNVFEN